MVISNSLLFQILLITIFLNSGTIGAEVPSQKFGSVEVVERPLTENGIEEVHCGLYSLMAAAFSINQPIQAKELFNGNYLSSEHGSNSSDLIRAAADNGLDSSVFHGVKAWMLSEFECPVLLQLNTGRMSTTNHWVTFVGLCEGGALIIDAPVEREVWTFAELEASWTGVAVPVWAAPEQRPPGKWLSLFRLIKGGYWLVVPAIFAVIVGIFFHEEPKWSSNARVVCLQVIAIWVLVSAWSGCVFIVQPERLAYSATIEKVTCWNSEIDDIKYTRQIDSSATIIDCRLKTDYETEHVDGAMSVPIGSSFRHISAVAESLKGKDDIVVYCQSVNCQWAAAMTKRLNCLGIDASVYAGGFDRFVNEAQISNE